MVSCSQQAGQSGKTAGGHCHDEAGSHTFDAAIHGLGHAADGFCPFEGEEDQKAIQHIVFPTQVDPLAVFLGQGVAFMPRGASVNR